ALPIFWKHCVKAIDMTRIIMCYLLVFISTGSLLAQNTDAKKILDEVSKKYDAYRTIQSEFTYHAKTANGETYADQGKLYLNKAANQYKIVLEDQDLISDGKSTWSVLKQEKEVQNSPTGAKAPSIGRNNTFIFCRDVYQLVSAEQESVSSVGTLHTFSLTTEYQHRNFAKFRSRINP